MKTRASIALVAAWLAVGCHSAPVQPADATGLGADPTPDAAPTHRRPTQITLSGPNGSPVMGYYVQDGQRVEISNQIPWTLEAAGISDLRVVKINQPDTVVADVRYYKDGALVSSRYTLGPAVRSIRIKVEAGFDASSSATAMTPMAPAH